MKKFLSFIAIALFASTMLTSCDDHDPWDEPGYYDEDIPLAIAQAVDGAWSGTLNAQYTDDNGTLVNETMEVDMVFAQTNDYSYGGTGSETDYYTDGTQETTAFTWDVNRSTGDIYIYYPNRTMICYYENFLLSEIDNQGYAWKFEGDMQNDAEIDYFYLTRTGYAAKATE